MRTLLAAWLLCAVVFPSFALAAPTAAQRRELAAIRVELLKVPALLRRKKVDEARRTLEAAEGRLEKLIREGKLSSRDRTVVGLKRLIDLQKRRLQTARGGKAPTKGKTHSGGVGKVTGRRSLTELMEQRWRAERKAKQERLERDLAYWQRILSGQGGTAEKQRALFHVGELNRRMKRWKQSAATFAALLREAPEGAWAISARSRLMEIKLESGFDLQGAAADAETLITWARQREKKYFPPQKKDAQQGKSPQGGKAKPANGGRKEPVKETPKPVAPRKPPVVKIPAKKETQPKTTVPSVVFQTPTEKESLAEAYWSYSLVRFLQGRIGYSRFYMWRYRALRGRPAGPQSADDAIRQVVFSRAIAHRPLTPLTLWKSNKPSYPWIVLAELLSLSHDFERSRDFATALLNHKQITLSDFQKSYIYYLRGRSDSGIRDLKEKRRAPADFLAAQKLDPKAPWADRCLFLAANAYWNHQHDAQRAIALWQRLMKEYPESKEYDRSAYYIGVIYRQEKRFEEARRALEQLLKDKPKSPFAKLVKEDLKKINSELARPGQ